MPKWLRLLSLLGLCLFYAGNLSARTENDPLYMVKVMAKTKEERNRISSLGIAIDGVLSDYVTVFATKKDITKLENLKMVLEVNRLPMRTEDDYPSEDKAFHNYDRLEKDLNQLAATYPQIVQRSSIGKSLEGRDLMAVRISFNPTPDSLPTALFFGSHHAREHLSTEVPLKLAQYLAAHSSEERIRDLLTKTEVWIVPLVNPDGAEYDISSGSYAYWRKNRRHNGGSSYGVDLNRNYGKEFAGPGSSNDTESEIYHGPSAFSEPETQAVRDFVRSRKKATTLLSFHTYSELILWPWGWTDDEIPNTKHRLVFETMGKKMAEWNHYTPEKGSALYLAAGDTTDWAYDELKIFAYTFELSPDAWSGGGFYPGAAAIEPTFNANLEPALYLIEKTQNPMSVLETDSDPLGIL